MNRYCLGPIKDTISRNTSIFSIGEMSENFETEVKDDNGAGGSSSCDAAGVAIVTAQLVLCVVVAMVVVVTSILSILPVVVPQCVVSSRILLPVVFEYRYDDSRSFRFIVTDLFVRMKICNTNISNTCTPYY